MLAQNVNENPLPNVDLRIFWINVRYKLLIPLLAGCLIAAMTHHLVKTMIPNQWEASTYVIRHNKNMSRQSDIPYLYLQTDLSTVIETILLQENIEGVIEQLDLDITPEKLRNSIKITKGNKSNVIKISATAMNKELSVNIANSVSDTFLKNYSGLQNAAAKKIHGYYEKKLQSTQADLYEAQYDEKLFNDKHKILDYEEQKSNLYKTMSELEIRYMDEKIHLADISLRKSEVDRNIGITKGTTLISETVRTNENTLTQKLKSELEILKKRYTDDNPKILHLLHKISVLEKQDNVIPDANGESIVDERKFGYNPVFGELQILRIGFESEIVSTQGNIEAYKENIDDVRNKLLALSGLEQEKIRIEQVILSQQDLIKNINSRLIETSLALESNIGDFDLLEYAQVPSSPKRSFRKVITAAVAFLFVVVLMMIVIIREFVDTTAKTAYDLENVEGQKFTAVLPNKDEVSSSTFYSQFHLLFSAIMEGLSMRPASLITVSGLSESDGKSFVINEMVEQLNHQNKKVLHIETITEDDFHPNISVINERLLGKGDRFDTGFNIVNSNYHKCYFEMSDKIYLDIYEKEKIVSYLDTIKSEYDVIVWELFSPNVHLQLFKTIIRSSDFNLILLKSGKVPKNELCRTVSLFKQWEVNNVGILLNLLPCKYIRKTL